MKLTDSSSLDDSGFDPSCDFCAIARGIGRAEVVFENDEVIAFFPLNPATPGHTLVIPKRHIANFLVINHTQVVGLSNATLLVARAVERAIHPEGMNLITSAGRAATQTIFHLHMHVVPRWDDDALGEIWPPPRPSSRQMLNNLGELVRDAFDDRGYRQADHETDGDNENRPVKHSEG